jgi:hypothetical protein
VASTCLCLSASSVSRSSGRRSIQEVIWRTLGTAGVAGGCAAEGTKRREVGDDGARRCCVVAWWAGWGAAVLGSNSGGEFGEAVRDPVPRINVGAKFVVAAVEVLNEGVPCADHFRRAQPLRPRIGRSRDFRRP